MLPTTIPLLPCTAPESTIEFYRALGFDVSDQQTRPYLHLAFSLDGIDLHFKEPAPGLNAADELSGGCLVLVDEVASYHAAFSTGLRAHYGHLPVSALPRIRRLRPGQSRFCLYDPSGNCVVFIRRDEAEITYGGSRALSGLAKALDNVAIFRDFKEDDVLAARALDTALSRYRDSAPRIELIRALADRIELAIAMGDDGIADSVRAELDSMDPTPVETEAAATELRAITDLQRWLA
ncbi:glyoxalase [Mycolicibacterium sp. HK-90]|uniref:glyoxalase n=1 Tax=Mycolicibacterium sp. HK-90 TaxID=3056937 RepID=UPI00265ADDF6|nr:glyoxalase [Mycolicibacterium sp. HK-90]WKG01925.1 glyoxalase [Mycolicibacterium sp. HK-90]